MGKYLVKRILLAIPTFLGITIMIFFLANLAPGGPLDVLASEASMSEEAFEQLKIAMGLDKPIIVRYGIWLGNFVRGDLGTSTRTYKPVAEIIGQRLGPSLVLTVTSLLFCLILSIPLGIMAASRPGSKWDTVSSGIAFMGTSLPTFFIALILVYVFAAKLGWLPATGMYDINGPRTLGSLARHLIMPAFILGFSMCGQFIKQTRGSLLEVFNEEYVKTARAKGLREHVVIIKHVFRNGLIPIVTMISLTVPGLLGGAVITETIFSWPGVGSLMVQSINMRDYNTIMGVTALVAAGVLIINIIIDFVYARLDPRISVQSL